jgi:hypothetical protein
LRRAAPARVGQAGGIDEVGEFAAAPDLMRTDAALGTTRRFLPGRSSLRFAWALVRCTGRRWRWAARKLKLTFWMGTGEANSSCWMVCMAAACPAAVCSSL